MMYTRRIFKNSRQTITPDFRNICLSLLALLLAVSGVLAQDIRTERVQFNKGTSGTVIEATITGNEIIDYKLNAREGQAMSVSMATDNGANYFNIMEPGEQYAAIFNGSMAENMYEGALEKSGDYTIRVYLMRSAARRGEKGNFRLEVNIAAE